MPMKHELLFLGKTKEPFLADGIDDYAGRLAHYTAVAIEILKEKRKPGQDEAALVVALDGGGQALSSPELAALVSRWEERGVKLVNYLLGGHLGLAESVLARADFCLSLSKLTFTHGMARLILLEQLYRAYTIKAGEKYHKG